ncbi:ATP-binding protein [Nonomuraea sp. NPDC059194]|uniref:ATP-binding protein n=1 Tax=Nonomuraea sp. NPDC059194 TaxID=3346764 RepID=UPI0036BD7EFA
MAHQIEERLKEELPSITVARELAEGFLTEAGYRGAHEDVLIVVSELVTNALLHGDGPPLLRLSGGASRIRVEVGDSAAELLPEPREPGPRDGWGLQVVERVCARWGTSPRDDGKVVWCELVAAG